MSDVVLEAWHDAVPVRDGRRTRLVLTALAVVGVLAGAVAATLFAVRMLPARMLPAPAPAVVAAAPAPPPAWRDILKPVRIYSLQAAAFAGAPAAYTARAHATGGGREDLLSFGQFDGDRPALQLRIFRRGTEAPSPANLRDALSNEAATLGLDVIGIGRPDTVPTRLGRIEVADIGIRRANGGERPCAGFRLALDQPALSVTGLACGRLAKSTPAMAMSRTDVGCLMERLDVASARDDRELIDFFAASELRRNAACAGMRLGPDGLHAPWLDEKPLPPKPNSNTSDKPATGHRRLRRH